MDIERELSAYDYAIDQAQIATTPAHPRDSAKLLVHDRETGTNTYDTFLHLDRYLAPGTLLILNDTKVVPARLPCYLPTGGKVELLWLSAGKRKAEFEALSPRILDIGTTLAIGRLMLWVVGKTENIYTFRHTGTPAQFHTAMMKTGTTPIPPYLKHTSLKEKQLRAEYQTIFAKREGSVAAPTASLHFTKRLFAKLKKKDVQIAYVTLHVNLGTFAPLTEEHLSSGKLHEEWYEIPRATQRAIAKAKKEGRPVIPVGTTALRTIESTARTQKQRGTTTLFLRPGDEFKVADGLITNFHVPRSSLMMLVAALLERGAKDRKSQNGHGPTNIQALYRNALDRNFRFYSFGDGMLIR
jgi:S-adenosylmethionine:tRNA ribosyltransferase-isomerase